MVKVTMLNSMASTNFVESLDKQAACGIEVLDLKDCIFQRKIEELSIEEAKVAAELITKRDLSVYCMSTQLFHEYVELGEKVFISQHLSKIDRVIEIANILKPTVIRLLAAKTNINNISFENNIDYIVQQHSWLFYMYQEAFDKIAVNGFSPTIENESHNCIFSTPNEILDFFDRLGSDCPAFFTYDIQNLWQMGTPPTIDVYQRLAPITQYVHFKGGQKGEEGEQLYWKSSLESATWPVEDIIRQVILDGKCQVLCLNPSHGQQPNGYNEEKVVKQDLKFVKGIVKKYHKN